MTIGSDIFDGDRHKRDSDAAIPITIDGAGYWSRRFTVENFITAGGGKELPSTAISCISYQQAYQDAYEAAIRHINTRYICRFQ